MIRGYMSDRLDYSLFKVPRKPWRLVASCLLSVKQVDFHLNILQPMLIYWCLILGPPTWVIQVFRFSGDTSSYHVLIANDVDSEDDPPWSSKGQPFDHELRPATVLLLTV